MDKSIDKQHPELQLWADLQAAISILTRMSYTSDSSLDKCQREMFRIWFKQYGSEMINEIEKSTPLFGTKHDGMYEINRAVNCMNVGLENFAKHNDIEFLREQTIDVVSRLYSEVMKTRHIRWVWIDNIMGV